MKSFALSFPSGTTEYLFEASQHDLRRVAPPKSSIIITDEHVAELHKDTLEGYIVLTMAAGEPNKTLATIERLTQELVDKGAHRGTTLVGLGGGVVTDVTGYLASSFMRGISVGFVPTTLLGMVDAAIGGKNGVNVGLHKNMLGTIRQPSFILYDVDYLLTLPDEEWGNGFAEVIKYGHIADARILTTLMEADIPFFQKHPDKLSELIAGCVDVKNKIVHADENESGLRKMLNFGHTAGHAFETLYKLGFSLLAGSVFGTAFVFFNLRQTLVLKRFFATPVRRGTIVVSEGIARMVFQLLTAIVIITIGHFAFGFTLVHGAVTFLQLLVLSALAIMVFMGFGFVVSNLAKNESVIPAISNIITLPQFLLAGTFFSIDAFPKWLQPGARILPLTFLNDAMRKVAFDGAGLWEVRYDILALIVWGVVLYIIASRIFKWE